MSTPSSPSSSQLSAPIPLASFTETAVMAAFHRYYDTPYGSFLQGESKQRYPPVIHEAFHQSLQRLHLLSSDGGTELTEIDPNNSEHLEFVSDTITAITRPYEEDFKFNYKKDKRTDKSRYRRHPSLLHRSFYTAELGREVLDRISWSLGRGDTSLPTLEEFHPYLTEREKAILRAANDVLGKPSETVSPAFIEGEDMKFLLSSMAEAYHATWSLRNSLSSRDKVDVALTYAFDTIDPQWWSQASELFIRQNLKDLTRPTWNLSNETLSELATAFRAAEPPAAEPQATVVAE